MIIVIICKNIITRVTIHAIFPRCVLARISILIWFKVPQERFENTRNRCHTPIGLNMQTKPNSRYFRQYRNPGQDASGKNGTYATLILILIIDEIVIKRCVMSYKNAGKIQMKQQQIVPSILRHASKRSKWSKNKPKTSDCELAVDCKKVSLIRLNDWKSSIRHQKRGLLFHWKVELWHFEKKK